jgi:8-oxo-dGTP pyrophosphatase MutT (NUDIX family)
VKRSIDRLARQVKKAARKLVVRQAGGIVFRTDKRGGVRVLVVTSRRNPGRWVLPKGSIKRRESAADAALREVHEESSVRGKIVGRAGTAKYGSGRGLVRVEFFLVRYRAADDSAHEARTVRWLTIDEAIDTISNASVRRVLADARRELDDAARIEGRR